MPSFLATGLILRRSQFSGRRGDCGPFSEGKIRESAGTVEYCYCHTRSMGISTLGIATLAKNYGNPGIAPARVILHPGFTDSQDGGNFIET